MFESSRRYLYAEKFFRKWKGKISSQHPLMRQSFCFQNESKTLARKKYKWHLPCYQFEWGPFSLGQAPLQDMWATHAGTEGRFFVSIWIFFTYLHIEENSDLSRLPYTECSAWSESFAFWNYHIQGLWGTVNHSGLRLSSWITHFLNSFLFRTKYFNIFID